MPSTLNISLPPALRQWVRSQIQARGFDSAEELIRDMIHREREMTVRVEIDRRLEAALKTPVSEMTSSDWSDIRRQGRRQHAGGGKE